MTRAESARDPGRVPRYWAPEVWRLRCAVHLACRRLPYATADARLLDGLEKWLGWTGKGQPVPGPWWTTATHLVGAIHPALADKTARVLVQPWCAGAGQAPAEPGGFRPLGG